LMAGALAKLMGAERLLEELKQRFQAIVEAESRVVRSNEELIRAINSHKAVMKELIKVLKGREA